MLKKRGGGTNVFFFGTSLPSWKCIIYINMLENSKEATMIAMNMSKREEEGEEKNIKKLTKQIDRINPIKLQKEQFTIPNND